MEQFPGFTVEERDGIFVYRVTDITRAAVDAWYEVDKQQSLTCATTTGHVMRMWYLERLVFPTPYFITIANLAVQETPDSLYESTAVVVLNAIGYNTMRSIFNRTVSYRTKAMFRVFQKESPALLWLEERRVSVAAMLHND